MLQSIFSKSIVPSKPHRSFSVNGGSTHSEFDLLHKRINELERYNKSLELRINHLNKIVQYTFEKEKLIPVKNSKITNIEYWDGYTKGMSVGTILVVSVCVGSIVWFVFRP